MLNDILYKNTEVLRTSVKQLRNVCDASVTHYLLLIALRLLFVLAKIKQVMRAQTRRSDITCFGVGVEDTYRHLDTDNKH